MPSAKFEAFGVVLCRVAAQHEGLHREPGGRGGSGGRHVLLASVSRWLHSLDELRAFLVEFFFLSFSASIGISRGP